MVTIPSRDVQVLEALGIGPVEEAVYQALLAASSASAVPLAETIQIPVAKVRRALAALESHGLVSRTAGKSAVFHPAPPSVACEVLILQRQEELDRARLAVTRLEEQFRAAPRKRPADLVEVVTGQEAVSQRFAQVQRAAKSDVMIFTKPPYASRSNDAESESLGRGVHYRAIYDKAVFGDPDIARQLWDSVAAGEEARVHARVPMKVAIIDRRIAIVPLSGEARDLIDGALLVYPSSLLEALIILWETFWEASTQLRGPEESVDTNHHDQRVLADLDARIVDLLLAGLTAEAIARSVGVGKTTVDRHISGILASVGSETRFQAGYHFGFAAGKKQAESN